MRGHLLECFYVLSACAIIRASATDEVNFQIPTLEDNFDDISLAQDSFWENFRTYESKEELQKYWIVSSFVTKDPSTGENGKKYKAEWDIQEPYNLPTFKQDKSLAVLNSGELAMIGRVLPTPIEIDENSTLVVQYEVQPQRNLKCGGAFLKLLPPVASSELFDYNGTYPIPEVIFGPDKCPPYTDEVHFGIKKTNPITGKPELKVLMNSPSSHIKEEFITHLYTLILSAASQKYEIRIDGEVSKAGSLLDDGAFSPGFNASKYVPDPTEQKPADWDDREMISDPDVQKPEDWDESEPSEIPDETDTKPKDWDESMPELISDPNSQRPEWWDEGNDGEWIPPIIRNRACYKISGCGEWKPRLIANPKYRGPWKPRMIKNENYKGSWSPKLVENPHYYEDPSPAKLENPIGTVIFEFWSGSKDLLIDNIYIGAHVEEAEILGNRTFVKKRAIQEKQIESEHLKHHKNAKQPKVPPSNNYDDATKSSNIYDILVDKLTILLIKFASLPAFAQNILAGLGLTLAIVLTGIIVLQGVMLQQNFADRNEIRNKVDIKEVETIISDDKHNNGISTGLSSRGEIVSRKQAKVVEE